MYKERQISKTKCPECGDWFYYRTDPEIYFCPYCGHKWLDK
jgi:ribosomal protein L37AE/L43A